MKYVSVVLLSVSMAAILVFSSCEKMDEDEPVIPKGGVEYTLTFKAIWSAETHPNNSQSPKTFPNNPHFSPLVVAAHNDKVKFWATGSKATAGIKSMAETGSTTLLVGEIDKALKAGNSLKAETGKGFNSPGTAEAVKFYVTKDFPLITAVSMLAPSPDWFAGIRDYNLLDGDKFKENVTLDVHLYDSGTDSGEEFTSANSVTNPAENITRFEKGSFSGKISGTGTSDDGKNRSVIGQFIIKKS